MSGGIRVGAAVLACLSACAGSGPTHRAPPRPEGMHIGRVIILDNHAFDDDAIVSHLATRADRKRSGFPTKRFDPLAFDLDKRRIVAFYRERGYFEAEVLSTGFAKDGFGDLVVVFKVKEGNPTRVVSIGLSGAPDQRGLDEQALLDAADIVVGGVFDHPRYLTAKRNVQVALIKGGFAHAKVEGTVQIDRDARTAAIELRADPGPLVHMGSTTVETTPSLERAVRARAAWNEGDVYDPARIARTQQRLRATGLFGAVRIDFPHEDRPPIADMTIHAGAAAKHEVKLGGGVEGNLTWHWPLDFQLDDSRTEVRLRGAYAVKRWPWDLSEVRVDGKFGVLPFAQVASDELYRYEARAALHVWDIGRPMTHSTVGGGYERRLFEAFRAEGPNGFASMEMPFLDDQLLVATQVTTFPQLDLTANDAVLAAQLGLDNPLQLVIVEPSVTWDSRDNALDAHRGTYAFLGLEGGTAPLYGKALADARGYWPLSKRVLLAARGRAGVMEPLDPGEDAPITQRFYAGGSNSHRGFGYRRLSPQIADADGDLLPIGGDALVEISGEVRVEIYKFLGGVAFLDGGDVTARPGDMFSSNLHWAVGLGARLATAIGPFAIDLGFRLNRTGPGEPDPAPDLGDRFVGQLSFGEAF